MSLVCDFSRLAPRARAIHRPPLVPDSATFEHPPDVTHEAKVICRSTPALPTRLTPNLTAFGRPPPPPPPKSRNLASSYYLLALYRSLFEERHYIGPLFYDTSLYWSLFDDTSLYWSLFDDTSLYCSLIDDTL